MHYLRGEASRFVVLRRISQEDEGAAGAFEVGWTAMLRTTILRSPYPPYVTPAILPPANFYSGALSIRHYGFFNNSPARLQQPVPRTTYNGVRRTEPLV